MTRIACLLFCICVLGFKSHAQQKTQINILNSDSLVVAKSGEKANRFIGNVQLRHQDMMMTCDSLYQYAEIGRAHV